MIVKSEGEDLEVLTTAELIRLIEERFTDDGEMWDGFATSRSSAYKRLARANAKVYWTTDNEGEIMLSRWQLEELGKMGYVVHHDLVYHPSRCAPVPPQKWDAVDDTGRRADGKVVIHGLDGTLVTLDPVTISLLQAAGLIS